MSSDWKELKLSDVAEIIGGGTPSTKISGFWNGQVPWITPKDLSSFEGRYIARGERSISTDGLHNSSARLLPKDSILLSSRAPIGYVAIAQKALATNQGFKSLVLKDGHNPLFFYYLLKSKKFYLEAHANGSTFKELSGSVVKNLHFFIPNTVEQNNITDVLSSLDEKIELNRQMCETLEKIASTLFKSWFVDFDPVKAKMEDKVPKGMHPELLDLFPDSFEESELGMIPKGWEILKIDDIAKTIDYVANGSFAALKENVTLYDRPEYALYIRTTDVNTGFIWNRLKFTDEKSYTFLKKSALIGRETIISNVGDVGTVFRPPVWFNFPMTLGSNAVAVIENKGFNAFLHGFFKSKRGQQLIASITSGSAQIKFNKTSLRSRKIIVPNSSLLEAYEQIEQALWKKTILLKSQIFKLSKLRDNLLPKLISGELRVNGLKDVESL